MLHRACTCLSPGAIAVTILRALIVPSNLAERIYLTVTWSFMPACSCPGTLQ